MFHSTTHEYKGWLGPADDLRSPIWTLRLSPAAALVCLVLAEAVFHTGFLHGMCLGLAAGMLISTIAVAFQITSLTLRGAERSDVDDLPITR